MTFFSSELPEGGSEPLCERLYSGDVFHVAASEPARAMAELAKRLVSQAFEGLGDARTVNQRAPNDEFFRRMKGLRRTFFESRELLALMERVVAARGFDLSRLGFDPPRLRAIQSDGHRNPAAAALYGAHRDTWYAHPSALITWWLPLHAIAAEESFVFFPDAFDQAVPNDSETFDYSEWIKDGPELRIGWQNSKDGLQRTFPSLQEQGLGDSTAALLEREEIVTSSGGTELIFAGTHLHRTRAHSNGLTRYSLDFRVVDLEHVRQGRGAPRVDNRSRGSVLPDYHRAAGPEGNLSAHGAGP